MGTSGNEKRIAQKLLDLKERIERERSRRSELQGELKSVQKQLKQNYSVETVEAAEKMLAEMEQRLTTIEGDIKDKIEQAEKILEQGDE